MNRSEHSQEKLHTSNNRSRSGRRSSHKKQGFYTKEVSQMYCKFFLRKSNVTSAKSNELFSPMSHVSQGSKGHRKITFENKDLQTCESKSYSTLNITSQNESAKRARQEDNDELANTVIKVVKYQQVQPFHNQSANNQDLIVTDKLSIQTDTKKPKLQVLQNITFSPQNNRSSTEEAGHLFIQENPFTQIPKVIHQSVHRVFELNDNINGQISEPCETTSQQPLPSQKKNKLTVMQSVKPKCALNEPNYKCRSRISPLKDQEGAKTEEKDDKCRTTKNQFSQGKGATLSESLNIAVGSNCDLANRSEIQINQNKENMVEVDTGSQSRHKAKKVAPQISRQFEPSQTHGQQSEVSQVSPNWKLRENSKYCQIDQGTRSRSVIQQENTKETVNQISPAEDVDKEDTEDQEMRQTYLIGSSAEMRFKQSKIYAERIQATSRLNRPDPYESAFNSKKVSVCQSFIGESSPENQSQCNYESSPDNVIKRIIRNTRKSQQRMKKVYCDKLVSSIQQEMLRETQQTKFDNQQPIQMKKRLRQINTCNSTMAAASQSCTPAVVDETQRSSSADLESAKRSSKRVHRRLRSDRRCSHDKLSSLSSKPVEKESNQKLLAEVEAPRILQMPPCRTPKPDIAPAPTPVTELALPLFPSSLGNSNLQSASNIHYVHSSECLSTGEPAPQELQPKTQNASQACLESSDSDVKFFFDPIKSNQGRESIRSCLNQVAGNKRTNGDTRNSVNRRSKELICTDSLEQIDILSPSQIDFMENEQQVQNDMLDTGHFVQYSPSKRRATNCQYGGSGTADRNQNRSNKKLLVDDVISEAIEYAPKQYSPPDNPVELSLNSKQSSCQQSRNGHPSHSSERSRTCKINEQKFYQNEIGQMRADLLKLQHAEEDLINERQEEAVQKDVLAGLSESSPNEVLHGSIPDAILGDQPAIIQESNDGSALNVGTANHTHFYSELNNSPLQYRGSSMQIQGQGMSALCGPASPPSKRQHNISMNDIPKHVKSDQQDNQTNRSIDVSNSEQHNQKESPNSHKYVTFSKQKRQSVEQKQRELMQKSLRSCQVSGDLIAEVDEEGREQSDQQQRAWFTFQDDYDQAIIPYQKRNSLESTSNDDFQLQPHLIKMAGPDEQQDEESNLQDGDSQSFDNNEATFSPSNLQKETISDHFKNEKARSRTQQQCSESAQNNETTKSAVSSKNSSSAVSSKRQRRSRKCRSSSNNFGCKGPESKRAHNQAKVDSPRIIQSSSIDPAAFTNCHATINATENEGFQLVPMAETIEESINNQSSCTKQYSYFEKIAKTPKENLLDQKFELTDVHINSDLNDKMMMPSDQKNATVFIKIDQEQYVPMTQQYQSVFTSPNNTNFNTIENNLATITSCNHVATPINAQVPCATQTCHQTKQSLGLASENQGATSLYGEERRSTLIQESVIDDRYNNISNDGSRNYGRSYYMTALKSSPIMQGLVNVGAREHATAGQSRQSSYICTQVQSCNTTLDQIKRKPKERIESKYNLTNVNDSLIIEENTCADRRLTKSAGGNFKHKKHSFDGKVFQHKPNASLFNRAEPRSSSKQLKVVDSKKHLKSVSGSKKKLLVQNSVCNTGIQNIRAIELSNEKPKPSMRNDRLRQIAQQYTFLNKSAVMQATSVRAQAAKRQIDNSRYKKVKCKNKAANQSNLSINIPCTQTAGLQHSQYRADSREGFKTLPQQDYANRDRQLNATLYLDDAASQPPHPRLTLHNFNPANRASLNNSLSITPKNAILNREDLMLSSIGKKHNFAKTINLHQSLEYGEKTRNGNRSVPRCGHGQQQSGASHLMATNYTSLTTAQQILKRKHTHEKALPADASKQQVMSNQKLKKQLTKSMDQFRSCQTGYIQQSHPKSSQIANISKVTEKIQKQYASFVGNTQSRQHQPRKNLNQLSKAQYLKPTNSYNLKRKITPLKNLNFKNDYRGNQQEQVSQRPCMQAETNPSVTCFNNFDVQKSDFKLNLEASKNGRVSAKKPKSQSKFVNSQSLYSSSNKGGMSRRVQFQSIMTTNRVLDKIVGGLNRRGSLKDLKEDLIEKSDNLVHQKSIIQLSSQIFQSDSGQAAPSNQSQQPAQPLRNCTRPSHLRRSTNQQNTSMIAAGLQGHRRPNTVDLDMDMDEQREFAIQQS